MFNVNLQWNAAEVWAELYRVRAFLEHTSVRAEKRLDVNSLSVMILTCSCLGDERKPRDTLQSYTFQRNTQVLSCWRCTVNTKLTSVYVYTVYIYYIYNMFSEILDSTGWTFSHVHMLFYISVLQHPPFTDLDKKNKKRVCLISQRQNNSLLLKSINIFGKYDQCDPRDALTTPRPVKVSGLWDGCKGETEVKGWEPVDWTHSNLNAAEVSMTQLLVCGYHTAWASTILSCLRREGELLHSWAGQPEDLR